VLYLLGHIFDTQACFWDDTDVDIRDTGKSPAVGGGLDHVVRNRHAPSFHLLVTVSGDGFLQDCEGLTEVFLPGGLCHESFQASEYDFTPGQHDARYTAAATRAVTEANTRHQAEYDRALSERLEQVAADSVDGADLGSKLAAATRDFENERKAQSTKSAMEWVRNNPVG